MTTSDDILTQLLEVLTKHLSPERLQIVLKELQETPGSASFRETVKRLCEKAGVPVYAGCPTGKGKSSD